MYKRTGVLGFLAERTKKDYVSFHMPGHKGSVIYKESGFSECLEKFVDMDITEVEGADNLFQAESVILETMNKYKALYGVLKSYILINGSSSGLIAAIMALCSQGDKLVVARNSHKSIYSGILLSGADPVYAYPETVEEYGISGEITIEEVKRCFEEAPDAKGLILPSPNYYGICSDISSISDYVHSLGKVIIVDQAHGAHLKFFDEYLGNRRMAAENLGADIVIDSTHKTLASFTQTAIANLCSERISYYDFEDKLQMIESTSPSYIMMASLDINAEIIKERGHELIESWKSNLDWFVSEASKIEGLRLMNHSMLDYTKLNLDMSRLGFDGHHLEKLLMEEGIFIELVTGNLVMALTGIGNSFEDYNRLINALKKISLMGDPDKKIVNRQITMSSLTKPNKGMVPREREMVNIDAAVGRICGSPVIPYPPGIPVFCPGEIINKEGAEYVKSLRNQGEKVIGLDERKMVIVGK